MRVLGAIDFGLLDREARVTRIPNGHLEEITEKAMPEWMRRGDGRQWLNNLVQALFATIKVRTVKHVRWSDMRTFKGDGKEIRLGWPGLFLVATGATM